MKLGLSSFILLLLLVSASFATISTNQTQSGGSFDDFHENTDVIRTHKNTSTSSSTAGDKNGTILAGDKIKNVTTVEDSKATTSYNVTELKTIILADGSLKNITVTRTVTQKQSKVLTTVERFFNKTVNLQSAREVALEFSSMKGTEMTQTDIDLINSLTYTDGIKFNSEYEYVQIKKELLDDMLKQIVMVFRSRITQATVDSLKDEILRCEKGVVVFTPDTTGINFFRIDAWLVFAEVFIATCGKNIPEVQIFAFSANKKGDIRQGLLNPTNAETVRSIMTRFLFREIHMMFNCPSSPIKETYMKQCSDDKETKRKENNNRRKEEYSVKELSRSTHKNIEESNNIRKKEESSNTNHKGKETTSKHGEDSSNKKGRETTSKHGNGIFNKKGREATSKHGNGIFNKTGREATSKHGNGIFNKTGRDLSNMNSNDSSKNKKETSRKTTQANTSTLASSPTALRKPNSTGLTTSSKSKEDSNQGNDNDKKSVAKAAYEAKVAAVAKAAVTLDVKDARDTKNSKIGKKK